MKIVYLAHRFPPHVGGIPVRAFRISKGLSQRGHEITVYTSIHPQEPRVKRINGMKVKRYNLLTPFIARFIKAPMRVMPRLFKLLSNKEIQEADIVQSFHFMSFVSLVAASLKLVRKKVFTLLPIFLPYYVGGWSVIPYRLTFGITILRYADFLTPETSFESNSLIQLGVPSHKIKVIPSAINSDNYRNLPDSIIFRKKHNIDANEKVVLFVGNPGFWKGTHHLILAMRNVLRKTREAKLVIVGPDIPKANLLLRDFGSPEVRDRTVMTGPLTGKSLISAYSAADVFVLTSKIEAFGTVFLEAAASGLPIVSTRTGVAPDIVVNGKNGLFVEYGKVDQISNAIARVLVDDNFERGAERRRNLVLKTYDYKTEVDQYEKVYQQLVR